MEEKKQRFSGKPVADQIVTYYKVNHVQKFQFSRPLPKRDPNQTNENEFANLWLVRTILTTTYPLPGILRWFPVNSVETYEISPLRNAIENMENTNKDLHNMITHANQDEHMNVKGLSMKLNGKTRYRRLN